MGNRAIDQRRTGPTLLVVEAARVANARQDQPVLYRGCLIAMVGEPCNGADRSRYEQEPIREASSRARTQCRRQKRCDTHTGKIVVAQRWVTQVARDQHFVSAFDGEKALAVGKMP